MDATNPWLGFAQFGFAALVAGFLLVKLNGTLDKLKDAVNLNSVSNKELAKAVEVNTVEVKEMRRELQVAGRGPVIVNTPPSVPSV